jgi:carboxypeptidase family protein/concanavalin A-like lectin/glucanase superfamily protein
MWLIAAQPWMQFQPARSSTEREIKVTPCRAVNRTGMRLSVTCLVLSSFCTVAFVARVNAQTGPLILISEPTSTRAIALESITLTREPFPLNSLISWSPDRRTRVVVFALNLELASGNLSSLTADAEDEMHHHYDVKVESAGPVPGQEWMSSLTLRLSDEMTEVGDVLVRIVNKGQASNRVRIAVGHIGGGPPDDPGSRPTPAPPYVISGRVIADGIGLAGVTMTLDGKRFSASASTDGEGNYSIAAAAAGDAVLSVSKSFYDFGAQSRIFVNLSDSLDGVDFTATRQKRIIQGQVRDDSGAAMPNVEVTLTGSDVPTPRKTNTNSSGSFLFPDLPAGFAYSVAPTSDSIFTYIPQSINQLVDTTTLTFTGARRSYSISGIITDSDGATGGVSVEVSGTGRMTITDNAGNYTFTSVPAGFDYTIVPSKPFYDFSPAAFVVSRLAGDRRIDFQSTPKFIVTGRVTDSLGHGLYGISINWSGKQTGRTLTSQDGTYSFVVSAVGNYTVTPSMEQDFYLFTPPNVSLANVLGPRVADFQGALNARVNPSYVLEFDGAPKTVDYSMPLPGDYNLFWPDGLDFGHFFWEFWAMPGNNAGGTYMISDGYGGAHAILFGVSLFGSREAGRYQLAGNVWNGVRLTTFGSDEGPAPFEWGHYAVGWDGQTIVTYFNGVPVGKTVYTGPRITPGGIQGCGRLLIGGSDHSNFIGRIAQVRGYETYNPHEQGGNSVFASFTPETVFSVDGSLLSYFFKPAENIADLSLLGQYGRQHPGLVRSTRNGVLYPCAGCPLPKFVVDPTAPDFSNPDNPGQPSGPVDTPAAVPSGVFIFDSFSRHNSTYALGGFGGLGSTEGGTFGPLKWKTNEDPSRAQPFGILNGRGVLLANATAVAWTDAATGVADLDITVDRHPGTHGAGQNTGISFRVSNSNNYFFTYSSDNPDPLQPQTLIVGYYEAGLRTNLATGVAIPEGWTTLRVITNAEGAIRVYADDAQIYSTINNVLSNNTGVGLYNNGPGLGLTNRWDNFRVSRAPQF